MRGKGRGAKPVEDESGRKEGFLRPEVRVLPETALVPEANRIAPPPNRFTHEVTRREPYFFDPERATQLPDGEFEQGTAVLLLVDDGGEFCRVCDARGLYVAIARAALKPL